MTDDDILNPVHGRRPLRRVAAAVRRPDHLEGEPEDRRRAARGRARCSRARRYVHSYMHCWRHKTPVIYRATAQWFAGMDDVPALQRRRSRRSRCARPRSRGIEATAFYPGVGQGAAARHDRQPARLVALAPAPVGRADAVLPAQGNRRAASAHAGAARAGRASASSRAASRPGSALDAEELLGDDAGALREEQRHARRLVRFRLHPLTRAARLARRPDARGTSSRPTSTSKARPAPRLVPFVAADRRA